MTDPHSLARFWAKTSGDSSTYHPLIAHSADVAAVFHAATAQGTALYDRFARAAGPDADLDRLRRVLVYLAGLHDIGKANHGFQDKDGPWARPSRRWPAKGHVIPVMASMEADGVFTRLILKLLKALPFARPAAIDALRTTIAHHGRPWVSDPGHRPRSQWTSLWSPDPGSGRAPLDEIARIMEHARGWSKFEPAPPEEADQLPWSPTLSNFFAGLLTICDWIGSTERIFEHDPEADADPDAYWQLSQEKAARAVRQVGLRPSDVISVEGLEVYSRLFPAVFPHHGPTTLQKLAVEVPLPEPGARLVIESETGSGKTEAVLALYGRLRMAGRVDGLVFALPTRATAKAMHGRIAKSIPLLHPAGSAPPLALAMGGSTGETGAHPDVLLDADLYPDPEDRAMHRWASQHHKKFFAAEIVVATVDQVLLAGLPVRHAHMRHALLARQLVVVDEVHSYDRYMNAVLNRVLDHHTELGGVVAFLSATLSRDAREGLAGGECDCSFEEAVSAPYPALSVLEPTSARWTQVEATTTSSPKAVRWSLASQTEQGDAFFDEAVAIAQAGGRVCLLRNTVREARATLKRLRGLALELLWRPGDSEFTPAYHSRFIAGDRAFIDAAALRDFGKGSKRRGVILVATQVIEQSLDVDFDWMMTDLAPVDVLLQRIGRLHRHGRSDRPAAADAARTLIQAPPEAFPPHRELRNQGFGWGTVYGEATDLELTRRLIQTTPDIVIPRDNRLLVERVYHPEAREVLAEESPDWRGADEAALGRRFAMQTAGAMGALDFAITYPDHARQYRASDSERIRTRIGDDRISVVLDRPVHGWYDRGATANEVPLRLDQLQRAGAVDLAEPVARFQEQAEQGPVYAVGDRLRIRYGPEGWVEEG